MLLEGGEVYIQLTCRITVLFLLGVINVVWRTQGTLLLMRYRLWASVQGYMLLEFHENENTVCQLVLS